MTKKSWRDGVAVRTTADELALAVSPDQIAESRKQIARDSGREIKIDPAPEPEPESPAGAAAPSNTPASPLPAAESAAAPQVIPPAPTEPGAAHIDAADAEVPDGTPEPIAMQLRAYHQRVKFHEESSRKAAEETATLRAEIARTNATIQWMQSQQQQQQQQYAPAPSQQQQQADVWSADQLAAAAAQLQPSDPAHQLLTDLVARQLQWEQWARQWQAQQQQGEAQAYTDRVRAQIEKDRTMYPYADTHAAYYRHLVEGVPVTEAVKASHTENYARWGRTAAPAVTAPAATARARETAAKVMGSTSAGEAASARTGTSAAPKLRSGDRLDGVAARLLTSLGLPPGIV